MGAVKVKSGLQARREKEWMWRKRPCALPDQAGFVFSCLRACDSLTVWDWGLFDTLRRQDLEVSDLCGRLVRWILLISPLWLATMVFSQTVFIVFSILSSRSPHWQESYLVKLKNTPCLGWSLVFCWLKFSSNLLCETGLLLETGHTVTVSHKHPLSFDFLKSVVIGCGFLFLICGFVTLVKNTFACLRQWISPVWAFLSVWHLLSNRWFQGELWVTHWTFSRGAVCFFFFF